MREEGGECDAGGALDSGRATDKMTGDAGEFASTGMNGAASTVVTARYSSAGDTCTNLDAGGAETDSMGNRADTDCRLEGGETARTSTAETFKAGTSSAFPDVVGM